MRSLRSIRGSAAWFPTLTPICLAESRPSGAESRSASRPSSTSASGLSSGCVPGRTSSTGYCCASSAQRDALRVRNPRLHNDQSPTLLPDLILDRCRPLVKFDSGAARRDPACPRHATKTARGGVNNDDMQRIWAQLPHRFYTTIATPTGPHPNEQPVDRLCWAASGEHWLDRHCW